jgi:hypothetical protein
MTLLYIYLGGAAVWAGFEATANPDYKYNTWTQKAVSAAIWPIMLAYLIFYAFLMAIGYFN